MFNEIDTHKVKIYQRAILLASELHKAHGQ